MQINPDEITSILRSRIEGLDSEAAELTEVGTVLSVSDGIARLHGLENCLSFELLELPHDVTGLALNLESDNVGAVLFGEWEQISEWASSCSGASSIRSVARWTARVRSTSSRRVRRSSRPRVSSSASRSRNRCRPV